jgi:integrase/recombinase XerD
MKQHTTPLSIEDSKRVTAVNTTFDTAFSAKIIARRCAEQPDRIFLSIPQDRMEWIIYMARVEGQFWHAADKLWSVPRNKELYQQFVAYFGDNLVIDKDNLVVLTPSEATLTPLRLEDVPVLPTINMQLSTPRLDNVKTSPINESTPKNVENNSVESPETPPQYETQKDTLQALEKEKTKIKVEKVTYDNQEFIGVHVPYWDMASREKIKTIQGRLWHTQAKLWIVPYNTTTYNQLRDIFDEHLAVIPSPIARVIVSPIALPQLTVKPEFEKTEKSKHAFKEIDNTAVFYQLNKSQQKAVTELENLLIEERKAYKTRQGYRNIFIQFLFQHSDTLPENVSNAQMKAFIVKRIKEEDISKSTQNQIISTLKAYYGRFLGQHDRVANLYRPEKEEHLPKMLTPDEIGRMLKQVGNLKHKCMLMLLYGSGLRVGELVRLQIKDLDFEEKTVFVDTGKHYKDRYTIFSEKSITYVKKYLAEHQPKPQTWVFESPDGGHYSERSVQQIFTEARDKAHIKKQLNTHSYRHAFATELLKASADLDFVRKVMGHASIKTTQVYLHVIRKDLTRTKSPLDDLDV